MGKQYSEQELKKILGQDMAESEIINRKIQEAYAMIKESDRPKKNSGLKRAGLKTVIMAAGTAAALILGVCVCAANPVLAAKIPLIGRIFQVEEKKVSYPGNYSEKADRLSSAANTGAETIKENNPYRQISGGITFTISECYADNMAMYLAVTIEAKDGFPKEFVDAAKNTDLDYITLGIDSTAAADFTAAGLGKVFFDPAYGTDAPHNIEGSFVDMNTFAGIIRLSLTNLTVVDEEARFIELDSAPKNFTCELEITNIYAYGPMDLFDPEDNGLVELPGKWTFPEIEVKVDDSETIVKNINRTNDDGVGIRSVRKTAYEIEAQLIAPEGENSGDYVIFMADADGKRLDSRGGNVETYNTYQRNVDKITIGICREDDYMNNKGDFDRLWDLAVFQTEVEFEKQYIYSTE